MHLRNPIQWCSNISPVLETTQVSISTGMDTKFVICQNHGILDSSGNQRTTSWIDPIPCLDLATSQSWSEASKLFEPQFFIRGAAVPTPTLQCWCEFFRWACQCITDREPRGGASRQNNPAVCTWQPSQSDSGKAGNKPPPVRLEDPTRRCSKNARSRPGGCAHCG